MTKFSLEKFGNPVDVKVRRSRASKHMTIRVTHLGEVRLSAPHKFNPTHVQMLLNEKEKWIREKIEGFSQKFARVTSIKPGGIVPIFGTGHQVVQHDFPKTVIKNNIAYVGIGDTFLYGLRTEMVRLLEQKILECVELYADKIGVRYSKYTLKDTKTRWGSCSRSGVLCFSWRLVFAPIPVVEYLVAHEVCHLKEMNHSVHFWKLVKTLAPDYQKSRAWLRINGPALHSYKFEG